METAEILTDILNIVESSSLDFLTDVPLQKPTTKDLAINPYREEGISNILTEVLPYFKESYRPALLDIFRSLHTREEEKVVLKMLFEYLVDNEDGIYLIDSYKQYDYERIPVSMEEMIDSKMYLGMKDEIFPQIKKDLCELFSDKNKYTSAIFTGAIGWGKSTMSWISLYRMIYELSCLVNPWEFYSLDSTTTITLINMSLTFTQAQRGVYENVRKKIRTSPYFQKYFPPSPRAEKELRFPKNILVMPTVNPIGYSVYGGVIDEVNFFEVITKSIKSGGRHIDIYDRAQLIYEALVRRQKTRFQKFGNVAGKLILSSSKQYPDDFLERRIEEAKGDPQVFIRDYAEWEPKPKKNYCGTTFKVVVGDAQINAYILKDGDKVPKGVRVQNPPIEYRTDYERNIEGAIREIGGDSVLTLSPFITQRYKIFENIFKDLKHPMTSMVTTLKDGVKFIPELIKKLPNKDALRYAHIDLALTRCSAGLCIGHICGEKAVKRRVEDADYEEVFPIVQTDLLLEIKPPHGGEIDIAEVRGIIYQLQSMGISFGKVSFDQFQSAESLQELRKKGFVAERLSIDSDITLSIDMKTFLYENRVRMYDHPTLTRELVELEMDYRKNKVGYRTSKDLADAFVGVLHNCLEAFTTGTGAILQGEVEKATPTEEIITEKDLALIEGGKEGWEEFDDLDYFD